MASLTTASSSEPLAAIAPKSTASLRRPSKLMAASLAARDASFRRQNSPRRYNSPTSSSSPTAATSPHHPHSMKMRGGSGSSSLRQKSWRTQEVEKMQERARLENDFENKRRDAESRIQARAQLAEQLQKKRQRKLQRKQMRQNKEVANKIPRNLRTMSQRRLLMDSEFEKLEAAFDDDDGEGSKTLAEFGAKLMLKHVPDLAQPLHLTCPITLCLFEDPVLAPSGHSYSKAAIVKYVEAYGRCPMTRQSLSVRQLLPNRALLDAVLHHQVVFLSAS